MDYNSPLIEGQFIKRYKRFFADVELNGELVVAHVPNTGSLKGICDFGQTPCRLLPADNPERKLKFTLEQVKTPTTWVGVNTHRANDIVFEAYTNKALPHWHAYRDAQREVKINKETRLDLKLIGETAHFVEIKSVTMCNAGVAMFPDAVTTRGQKHLVELMKLIKEGARCEILFLIQREDAVQFSPAIQIDPEYAKLLSMAKKSGVRISVYSTTLNCDRINLNSEKKLDLLLS